MMKIQVCGSSKSNSTSENITYIQFNYNRLGSGQSVFIKITSVKTLHTVFTFGQISCFSWPQFRTKRVHSSSIMQPDSLSDCQDFQTLKQNRTIISVNSKTCAFHIIQSFKMSAASVTIHCQEHFRKIR